MNVRLLYTVFAVSLMMISIVACDGNKTSTETSATSAQKKIYTCSMHPQIIRDAPGNCPICGMTLIEKTDGVALDANISIDDVVKPTNASVISNVKQHVVQTSTDDAVINAVGSIEYDTRSFTNIAARVGGRIEKLYVKFQFQPVSKGQKLYDVYSPELQTDIQNLIYLLTNDSTNAELITATKQKLQLIGMAQKQIDEISRTKKSTSTISIYSPADGYVVSDAVPAAPSSASMQSDNMQPGVAQPSANAFSVKEGQYVQPGETIFKIVNTTRVWAVMKIYAGDIGRVKKGQRVKLVLNNYPDDTVATQVDFVEPVFTSGSKFLNLRAYVTNDDNRLRRGDLFKAVIQADAASGIWIPATAVVDLGNEQVVYMRDRNMFFAHRITRGTSSGGNVLVVNGLKEGDVIAMNAQYLMDSESLIKIKHP